MISKFNIIDDLGDLHAKKVIVRLDLNVPMHQGKVCDDTRIMRALPTLTELISRKAKIIVISHFGRPEGKFDVDYSLAPITDCLKERLSEALGYEKNVHFGVDCIGNSAHEAVDRLENGDILLLENLRFHEGEKSNDPEFADSLARLGDVFINDAFSCSHRAHASIVGIASRLPSAAGFLMCDEIENLEKALNRPSRPVAAIVGGSKISTKINMLKSLSSKVDYLFIGGAMANTFLYAQGVSVGESLYEKDLKATALEIQKIAEQNNCQIILPEDVIVAENLEQYAKCWNVPVDKVDDDKKILDIGGLSIIRWGEILKSCKTVVWNGPLGAFEYAPFDCASISLARIVACLTYTGQLNSVAGGGDVLAALARAGLRDSFTYISTAGGAFLEWLEGSELVGVKVLYSEKYQNVG